MCIHFLLGTSLLFAASGPKDSEESPLTEKDILAILKDKGELTWLDGSIRVKAKKLEEGELVGVTLEQFKDNKIVSTMKAQRAKLTLDVKKQVVRVYFPEVELEAGELSFKFFGHEFDFPVPRRKGR